MCNAIGLCENGLTHTGQETKTTTIWESLLVGKIVLPNQLASGCSNDGH